MDSSIAVNSHNPALSLTHAGSHYSTLVSGDIELGKVKEERDKTPKNAREIPLTHEHPSPGLSAAKVLMLSLIITCWLKLIKSS